MFASDDIGQQGAANLLVGHHKRRQEGHASSKLVASGRYLFIPSIQLAHRGNYSCVAVNRLGTGTSFSPPSSTQSSRSPSGRDSYQLRVALAPSFVQQLPTRTYWQETAQGMATAATVPAPNKSEASSTAGITQDSGVAHSSVQSKDGGEQLKMVCRVQCEPICHIEWLRNGEPIDILSKNSNNNNNNNGNMMNNYVSYHVRHTIMDENEAANMFRSLESELVLSFHGLGSPASQSGDSSKLDDGSSSSSSSGSGTNINKKPLIDRDKLLERRYLLNNSNFTCRSSPNTMGGPVESTTIFSVQCE